MNEPNLPISAGRTRRDRGHRRIANAIARELQDSLAMCRAAGGQCGTIEAALALACQRLGGCPAPDANDATQGKSG